MTLLPLPVTHLRPPPPRTRIPGSERGEKPGFRPLPGKTGKTGRGSAVGPKNRFLGRFSGVGSSSPSPDPGFSRRERFWRAGGNRWHRRRTIFTPFGIDYPSFGFKSLWRSGAFKHLKIVVAASKSFSGVLTFPDGLQTRGDDATRYLGLVNYAGFYPETDPPAPRPPVSSPSLSSPGEGICTKVQKNVFTKERG